MKVILLGCRLVLGLIFFVFGLNDILHFLPIPLPTGDALTWLGIMIAHHYMNFVGALMVIAGLLLLVNRFVPLALIILAPIIVNILLYEALLWPHNASPSIIALLLELILIAAYFRCFIPLLAMNPEADVHKL